MDGLYAVVKCLALGLSGPACKILWKSDARSYLKDILVSHMDREMQLLCSTSKPSIFREGTLTGDETVFSLEKFEEEIRENAPLTNNVLESLCLLARQKQIKRSDGEVSNAQINKAMCIKLTVCSMMLNCRCPQLSVLSSRIGIIVRHSGASRTVSMYCIFVVHVSSNGITILALFFADVSIFLNC